MVFKSDAADAHQGSGGATGLSGESACSGDVHDRTGGEVGPDERTFPEMRGT